MSEVAGADGMGPNPHLRGERILVTGASGLVGRALLHEGRRRRANLHPAHRCPRAVGGESAGVVVGEIDGGTRWAEALAGVGCVIHLAARVHVLRDRASDPLAEFRRVNVEGTRRLAEEAARAGVRRLVFVSSIKVYGGTGIGAPLRPDSPLAPEDPYGRSKAEAEDVLRGIESRSALDVVVVRPPLVYGPRVGGNFLRLLNLVDREIPLPFAKVRNRRSIVYVDNLAALLLRCARHPAAARSTFLVDDGQAFATPDLVRELAAVLERRARLLPVPPRALRWLGTLSGRTAEIERLIGSLEVDGSFTRKRLGWRPSVSSIEGMRRTGEWYRREVRTE